MIKGTPYLDVAGYYHITWQRQDGGYMRFKLKTIPEDSWFEAKEAQWYIDHEYDSVQQLKIDITKYENVIEDMVVMVKNNPNLNMTQWNNYLATKLWYEAYILRFFVFAFGQGLAEHYGVDLEDYTEAKFLQKVRDFIVQTPAQKLRKIIYGRL